MTDGRFTRALALISRLALLALSDVVMSARPYAAGAAPRFVDPVARIEAILYADDFETDLSQWAVEQVAGGTVRISNGYLDIDDSGGCTVWFRWRLSAPLMIEYDVIPVQQGGPNDRVSDADCFWMAVDPEHPDDFFANSAERGGELSEYDSLRLYYVGYGGNGNTTTRFRRYPGTGERPLLPGHDLRDARYLLTPNARMRIQLIVSGNSVQYLRGGEAVFDVYDPEPYHEGWFGFRTVSNHMRIDDFRVYHLRTGAPDDDSTLMGLIQRAGNTDDDGERLALLERLRKLPGLDEPLKKDADRLIAEIDQWINAKSLPYFAGAVRNGEDYDFGIAEDSPLYPLVHLYQGRMLVWYANEMGGVWSYPERRRLFFDRARHHFEETLRAFPRNRIARMYLGERIAPHKPYPAVLEAPAWAVHQREALERLADIIHWWIDHRMQPSGAFGGGWGDDCEMWRSWVPVLIGFDDPKIGGAQARLSHAIMTQPHMKGCYTAHLSDVQHTAEDSADSLTPMMHLEPDNEFWAQAALRLAELMETLWTGVNERGQLQFKSTYFSSLRVDEDPVRACDTVYHPRAVQPTLLYWQRTGDERLTKLFSAWMDTWVDASMRRERGKPAGIIPSAIHWPDGSVGGLPDEWWDPRPYTPPTIYRWPSALPYMTQTLLLTHHITGDAKYLQPLRSMAEIRLNHLKSPKPDPEPGSEPWCAARLGGLTGALAKYAFLTGSDEFDALLEAERIPYVTFRTKRDREGLNSALSSVAETLRYNFQGYTSEVRFTDRVFTFPRLLSQNAMFEEAVAGFRQPYTGLLYSTVTGDPGDVGYFPINAVRWLTPPRDIAALVTDSGRDAFAAELFHFGDDTRRIEAELYLLAEGDYVVTLAAKAGDDMSTVLSERTLRVEGHRTRIRVELPPRRLCVLTVRGR